MLVTFYKKSADWREILCAVKTTYRAKLGRVDLLSLILKLYT